MRIQQGDEIRSRSGELHLVLKVEGEGFVQTTNGGWGVQSHNEPKAKTRVTIWDGYFTNTRDIDEVDKMYTELIHQKIDNVKDFLLYYRNPDNGAELEEKVEKLMLEAVDRGGMNIVDATICALIDEVQIREGICGKRDLVENRL